MGCGLNERMTIDYKKRYNNAVELVRQDLSLPALRVGKLYSPIWMNRQYRWFSPLDSDGILYGERNILSGVSEGGEAAPKTNPKLRVGVILQSEFSTSNTKPNPIGKAFVSELPLGVWVDLDTGERVRLDEVYVLFVVPNATAASKKKTSATALKNVRVAAELSVRAYYLEVNQGSSAEDLAKAIKKVVNGWVRGAGRLPGT